MKKKTVNITLSNNDGLVVINKGKVIMESSIELLHTNTTLPIQVTADFSNIPAELHHRYYKVLEYTFHKNVYANNAPSEDESVEEVKKPWYKRLFK
jgi:hypothetical protein